VFVTILRIYESGPLRRKPGVTPVTAIAVREKDASEAADDQLDDARDLTLPWHRNRDVIRRPSAVPLPRLVSFADREVRDVDMAPVMDEPVFEPLRDPAEFAKVHVDPETHTIAWPPGADLDSDVLYDPTSQPASGRGPKITAVSSVG
jgi:Protein of unknown function (DUF2442)